MFDRHILCPLLLMLASLISPRALTAEAVASGIGYDRIVAVVIGIGAQQEPWKPLPNAVVDAERFADLMRDRGVKVITLYDEEATEAAIVSAVTKRAVAELGDSVTRAHRNLLLVYFVGHGHTADGEGFLIPYGAKGQHEWLALRQIDVMAAQVDEFRHQLYILGSCFGGALLRNGSPVPPDQRGWELVRNDPVAAWLDKAMGKRSRIGLTAGDVGERIPDGEPLAGSSFGNALVNALQTSGGGRYMGADFNRDHCVSSAELTAYVEGRGRTRLNTPRSGALAGDDAGTVALCGRRFVVPEAVSLAGVRLRSAMPSGFVEVPTGHFRMGAPDTEKHSGPEERPVHPVRFSKPLWVQAHEVTQRQWFDVMGTQPSFRRPFSAREQDEPDICDSCPVENVNWYEAVAFANKLSVNEGLQECYALSGCTGKLGAGCGGKKGCQGESNWTCERVTSLGARCSGYRLPTEAEWEYFARAGTTTRFSAGDKRADIAGAAWFADNGRGISHPVGQKEANPWGLFDVHGNVWEWCDDAWTDRYDAAERLEPVNRPAGTHKVIRGGAFGSLLGHVRSAVRLKADTAWRGHRIGFRLVRTP